MQFIYCVNEQEETTYADDNFEYPYQHYFFISPSKT